VALLHSRHLDGANQLALLVEDLHADCRSHEPFLDEALVRPCGAGQNRPTRPATDAMSFSGSYAIPWRNTISTLRTSAMLVVGSPLTTTRSACWPGASVPMRSARP